MKKTFKLFTSLFVIAVMFLGIKVSAANFPNEITVTGFNWIGDYNAGRQYGMFTAEPNVGGHVYCLDPDMKEPKSGSLVYFDMSKSFSQAQINNMVAVLRTSGDPNYGLGLGTTDSYYVTQFALWYAEYGKPVAGQGKGPFTSKTDSFFSSSSTYSSAYNKLISAIDSAKGGVDYTETDNYISVVAASGNLSQDMEEKVVNGKKVLLSKTLFQIDAPGNYTISVDGGYLANEDGTVKNATSLTADDTFRIATSIPEDSTGSVSATFSVVTNSEYVTSYELGGYQKLNSNGLQRLVMLLENKEKLETSYTVNGNYDNSKPADVSIAKVNKEGKLIAGAKLGIYLENGSLVNSYDSKTDYITVKLSQGKYYLKEIAAPDGYLLSDEEVHFSIDKDGNVLDSNDNVVVTKSFTITDDLPTIKVKKVNEKGIPVKNAKIVICSYDMDTKTESNCNFEWITDGNVKELTVGVDFGKIADGSYIIKEVEAPHGFEISEPKYITVKDGQIYGDLQKDTVTIVDVSYLDVSKTDATGQNEIAGANMKLYDANGKLIEEWVSTTEEHRIKGLNTGEIYEIVEELAPEGFVPLKTSIPFVLNEDGTVTTCNIKIDENGKKVCEAMSQDEILKIKNEVTKIKISKVDITNEQELPGAVLQILDENHKPVYQNGELLEWTSTNEPHYIEMLPVGKYILVETFSPEGYVAVSNEVNFEVKAETGIQAVVFENDVTKVLISKKDFTTGEEVPGATLQILDENHKPVYQNGEKLEWISGDEPHYIEKLPVGKYILVETIVPEGYQEGMIINGVVTTEYEFEVKDNMLLKIDVYNETIGTPNTAMDATATYIVGGMTMVIGFGTMTIARRKNKEEM